jgi:integrase
MAHVEDRWFRRAGGELIRTPRYGTGLRYRARWIDPDGRERSESFPDKKKGAADNFLIKIAADMLAGTYLDPEAGKETLRSYAARWLASRTHDATTRETVTHRLDKHILPRLGSYRLDQLSRSPSVISGWVRGLTVADSYRAVLLHDLSAILGAAVDDGLIIRNPCRADSVKTPQGVKRKLRPWSTEMVDGMRTAIAAGSWLPPARRRTGRYAALVDVGAGLGLRQGECFGLPADAVQLGGVHVRVQVRIVGGRLVFAPPKAGRERDVPLPQAVQLALNEHMAKYPPRPVTLPWRDTGGEPRTERLIFTNARGSAISRTGFNSSVWLEARKAAGIAAARSNGMHALRHYYASVLLTGGVDIEALSEYLGHHDPGFTLRTYAHLRPSAEGRALRAIEAAFAAERDGTEVASSDTYAVSSET